MYALVLGGSMKGRTINLNGYKFIEGMYIFPSLQLSNLMSNYGGLIQYFKTCYQAELKEVPNDQLKKAPAPPESIEHRPIGPESSEAAPVHVSTDAGIERGDTGSISSGDGYENAGLSHSSEWTPRQRRIASALMSLNPDNDDDWTTTGLPRVDAIEDIMQDSSVTRQEIIAVAPDFVRPEMGDLP